MLILNRCTIWNLTSWEVNQFNIYYYLFWGGYCCRRQKPVAYQFCCHVVDSDRSQWSLAKHKTGFQNMFFYRQHYFFSALEREFIKCQQSIYTRQKHEHEHEWKHPKMCCSTVSVSTVKIWFKFQVSPHESFPADNKIFGFNSDIKSHIIKTAFST